jgi:hypothetical protein
MGSAGEFRVASSACLRVSSVRRPSETVLKHLKLSGVGPAPTMEAEFAPRLNIITGDNGLGKSFLLDLAWWALSRRWASMPALPHRANGSIEYSIQTSPARTVRREVRFERRTQSWPLAAGRPPKPGLVIYAQVDGGYSVWDPARNYWRVKEASSQPQRPGAYQFSPDQIWNGLRDGDRFLCNGLIADWAGWQKGNSEQFKQLCRVLATLSASPVEPLQPGELTRISLDDVRDMPTIRMPYGQDVPVLHCSAGMRRVLALAYLLVWTWQEHVKASKLLREREAKRIIFLIDEIEGHLHPRWQRHVFNAVLRVMNSLLRREDVGVQVIAATHSPLILASLEPLFDETKDRLFELDLVAGKAGAEVELRPVAWRKHGDVNNWLTSELFQLGSASSIETEAVLKRASEAMSGSTLTRVSWEQVDKELRKQLRDSDPFWTRWNYVAAKRGWLK